MIPSPPFNYSGHTPSHLLFLSLPHSSFLPFSLSFYSSASLQPLPKIFSYFSLPKTSEMPITISSRHCGACEARPRKNRVPVLGNITLQNLWILLHSVVTGRVTRGSAALINCFDLYSCASHAFGCADITFYYGYCTA